MNTLNDKKQLVKKYDGIIIIGIVYFIFHLFLHTDFGDDSYYFIEILNKMNILEFVKNRYETHSSRLIIDLITVNIVHTPYIWKIMNILVFLLYPFAEMSSAGWIATNINYSWILLATLASLTVIEKKLQEKEIKWYNYAVALSAVLLASNHEQGVIVTLFLLILLSGYLWFSKKKKSYFVLLQIAVTISGIVFALTCPGNKLRKISDIKYWNPEFIKLEIDEKIYLALLRIYKLFIAETNFIVLAFCFVLLVAVVLKNKKRIIRVIASIPFVIKFIFTFKDILVIWFQDINRIFYIPEEAVTVKWNEKSTYVPILVLLIFIFGIVIAILAISENMVQAFLLISVLAIGTTSCLIMGFSPTLWESKSRTAIFMYFSLVYCASYICAIINEYKDTTTIYMKLELLFGILCSLQVIDTFCKILKGPYPLG